MDLVNRSRKLILQRAQDLERTRNIRVCYIRWLFVLAILLLTFLERNFFGTATSPNDSNVNVYFLIGGYAVYSLLVMLVTMTFARQATLLPFVSLALDVVLAVTISWMAGLTVFAIAYIPALLMCILIGVFEGGIAVLAVAAANIAYYFVSTAHSFRSEDGMAAFSTGGAAFLVVVALFGLTQTRVSILKANNEMLEEAIANANSTNLIELQNRVKAVYRVASTLSATLDYQKVVRNILIEVQSVFQVSVGAVLLFEGTMNNLRVVDTNGLTDEEKAKSIDTRSGLIRDVLSEAQPVLIEDDETMNDLRKIFPSAKTCRTSIIMPLRGGYEVYGLLMIASELPGTYHESDLELMVALTSHTIIAMQNATLYRNLLEDRNKMLTAEEEVRHTLARNLHDGPAQAVAAFSMQTEFIRRLFKSEPERAINELALLGKQAQQTSKEIRTLLYELRPLVLESQGLNAALEQYAQRFPMAPNDPVVHFTANEDYSGRLNPAVETTIFTILQEAVNNARKHAKAHNIWLHVEFKDGFVVASSQDDGQGFDTVAVDKNYDQRGSLGLTNMRERAALVGGLVNIVSRIGQGTSVIIRIPLTEATLAAPTLGTVSLNK